MQRSHAVASVPSVRQGDTTLSEGLATPADGFSRAFDPDGATLSTVLPFPGECIGRYLLSDKLAQGSFGFVFRAFDVELDREVALKVLNPDHANKRDIVQRFLLEAKAAARVVHPGVVTILDCGQHEGAAYIAMDLLDGESLTSRLENCGRMLPQDAIEIARQIASAVEAAHAAGVLHRDLKPDNIFIVKDSSMPDGLRVKILDFGLAKVLAETGRKRTGIQSVMGTPRYMSPEQCRSSTNIDHRSDIYSLGCILFELITGTAPFDGGIGEIIEAHLEGNIPRASTFSGCSPHLDELITQLMAKDPARRPQSMTAVRRALDKVPLGRMGSQPAIAPPHRTPLPRIGAIDLAARLPRVDDVSSMVQTSKRLPVVPKSALPPPMPAQRAPRASSVPPRAASVPAPLTLTPFKAAHGSSRQPLQPPHSLPPYYPRLPTAVPPQMPTPIPTSARAPSMLTAMAMSMAFVPAAAVPVGLPAPTASMSMALPPLNKWPIVLLGIACVLIGIAAALLFV